MARYTLTLLALCALCLALADARNYKGTSREQELIQQQIEAQVRAAAERQGGARQADVLRI